MYFVLKIYIGQTVEYGANQRHRSIGAHSFCRRSRPRRGEVQQKKSEHLSMLASFGALPGTRTLGPLIKSQLLYQLS